VPLTAGDRLGPYEVVSLLGTGGMGEVYRARDTKLGRDVAIKVLLESVASDPERLARFHREAHVLASLSHPNIAAIYGFEDSSPSTGSGQAAHALVMELVEGPTLADRIARGPIPLNEALPIAGQIAEALKAAHDQGIIHRDLKPANIKVAAGVVKVLDFGLAKVGVSATPSTAISNSPTMLTGATRAGVVVGTAAYMSPEQACGEPVDRRSDIWAFGCVLFEMLTGRPAFPGATVSEIIVAVLTAQPDLPALPPALPASVRELVVRCLEKDRSKRVGDIAVAQFVLGAPTPSSDSAGQGQSRRSRQRVGLAALGAFVAGAAAATTAAWQMSRPAPLPVTRTSITATGSDTLSISGSSPDVAISADGSTVVFVGSGGVLFVRTLDALDPVAIPVGGAVHNPFLSPDGRWIGFEVEAALKKIPITGGSPFTITRISGALRGAWWAPDHTIIYTTGGNIVRVADSGGTPEPLVRPDSAAGEVGVYWPMLIPGTDELLFTALTNRSDADAIHVSSRNLKTGAQKVVLRGASHARYVASGQLVYVASGQLFAAPFDARNGELRGAPQAIVHRLVTTQLGGGNYAAADNGTLVYVDSPGGTTSGRRSLVWVDRAGREEPTEIPARAYSQVRLSPDGTRAALYSGDEDRDIWIWDFAKKALNRLTFDPGADMYPVWTPDGRSIIVGSQRDGGVFNLWRYPADGSGVPRRLTSRPRTNGPHSMTSDGKTVVFEEVWPQRGRDLMRLSLDSGEITPVLQTPFEEVCAQVSPNDRWLAYETDATGRREVHVRPFPNAEDGHWQVSLSGGRQPSWTRGGRELVYSTSDGAIMSVDVDPDAPSWSASAPKKLFQGRYVIGDIGTFSSYGVSADGQRFLMIKDVAPDSIQAVPNVVVVQHWNSELKGK